MHPRLRNLLLTATALLALGATPGVAGPEGPAVVGGAATISGAGTSSVTVNQSSNRAIVNWHTFNIGTGERVQFNQPGSSSVVLNRVTGGLGPSQIFGTLTANGQVFVINRDGVLFGAGSVINTAGFLASTNDIRNSDFMAGRYIFNIPGRPDASIVNMGTITASSGGFAALVAPGVRNSGTISATLGTVALAAGNSFTLDMYGDKLITLAVNDQIASQVIDVATGKPLKSLVTNDGKIRANGGRVELTAAAARTVVDSVINTSGVIKANSIGTRNGMIVLSAATGASKPAGAPAQTVKVSGTLSASGKKPGTTGGTILVTGEDIKFVGTLVDASGRAGGGKVMIGGDWGGGKPGSGLVNNQSAKLESYAIATATTVSVDAGTTINASATESGHGGKVVLWSDNKTTFAGTILARGGESAGNGGFVETSGHRQLVFTGNVDTRAPNGAAGTLLLDPADFYIVTTLGFSPPGASEMTNVQIQNLLANQNVVIATDNTINPVGQNGDIFVNASVNWSSNNTLTLNAFRHVNVGYMQTISNTGGGSLVLRADSTGTGSGTVNFLGFGVQVNFAASTGTVHIFYNPTNTPNPNKYDNPQAFGSVLTAFPGQLTTFMLVNSAADLQLIGTGMSTLNKTYALGRSFSGGAFNPIGSIAAPFTGVLEGLGHTISDLNITATGATTNSIGMFAAIGAGGRVRNLKLANITVTANPNNTLPSQSIGTLAGESAGSISNVAVLSGTVSHGSVSNGIKAGGIVGHLRPTGTLVSSSAAVNVSVGNSSTSNRRNYAGGAVGLNQGGIAFTNAHGAVSGGSNSSVGGLAGQNGLTGQGGSAGTILLSSATGTVTLNAPMGDESDGGGLVGTNQFGLIAGSTASGAVNLSGHVSGGGLVGNNEDGGVIGGSAAFGNVNGTNLASSVGAFVGDNDGLIFSSFATGNVNVSSVGGTLGAAFGGGFVGLNGGVIHHAYALGSVTGGDGTIVGGFAGINFGSINFAYALGNVLIGSNAIAGGFVGLNAGLIYQAFAAGSVSEDAGSVLGGFAGLNVGRLLQTIALGAVTGGDSSIVGGHTGINLAITDEFGLVGGISQSYSLGAVSGGANSIVAGGIAVNDGLVDQFYAAGRVSGGPGSDLAGLIAVNNPSGSARVTNSYWDTNATGQTTSAAGTGLTTRELITALPPGFDPAVWSIQPGSTYPYLIAQNPFVSPFTPRVVADNPDAALPLPLPQPQIIENLVQNVQLAALNTDPVVSMAALTPRTPQQPQRAVPANPYLPPGFERRIFDVPPLTETRFIKDEVLLQISTNVTIEQVQEAVRRFGLTLIEHESLGTTTGSIALRFRIGEGQSLRDIIRRLASVQILAVAQPIYVYVAGQDPAADPASRGAPAQQGDAAQYILQKLKLTDVHRIVKGANIPIAVIDSEIDAAHPDLAGVIAQRFSAAGAPETPHPHGTGMAGAIASRQRLLGVAPSARLLAVHAFSSNAAKAESTTYNILKGLDWSVKEGARIINMSFAGPKDPSLERSLKAAYDKGIVLIAAAGNAGPRSPPLYPGADKNVIAVTATDVDDKLFAGANRGGYVAVAAPGVDILVPAPNAGYQLTTGTSVAAAEVSGVVALLLERNPRLKPADIRRILTTSAKRLGPGERNDDFGSGLVDPLNALQAADPRTATAPPPRR